VGYRVINAFRRGNRSLSRVKARLILTTHLQLKNENDAHGLKRTKNTLPGSESISFWYLFLILEESPYTVDFLLTL